MLKITNRKKFWALAILMFWLGYEAKDNHIFPVNRWYKRTFVDQPEPVKTKIQHSYSVYTDINSKARINCPKPEETQVYVAFGQSNAANSGGHRFQNDDARIINFFNGHCYVASDPMLGASEFRGSIWVPFAKQLKTNKNIMLLTFAIGDTKLEQWIDPEDLAEHFDSNMAHLRDSGFKPHTFIWFQGESNASTPPDQYQKALSSYLSGVKNNHPKARIALSGTSYCARNHNSKIVAAQKQVANDGDYIWLGSSDQFSKPEYRYDDCHLSERGSLKVAKMFAEALSIDSDK